eukprot:8075718-Heterocapsa_arctica.AAC.1
MPPIFSITSGEVRLTSKPIVFHSVSVAEVANRRPLRPGGGGGSSRKPSSCAASLTRLPSREP